MQTRIFALRQLSIIFSTSPNCEGIINLQHDSMFLLIFIPVFLIIIICLTIYYFDVDKYNPKICYGSILLLFVYTFICSVQ